MALGIVGATVMPHNLYLHSSISQSRKIDRTNPQEVATAVRFATWDSNIQLSAAFVVNCLLLILGSALFFGHSEEVGTFQRCMMPYKIQRSRERWLVQPLVFFCRSITGFRTKLNYHWNTDRTSRHGRLHPYEDSNMGKTIDHSWPFCRTCFTMYPLLWR